MTDAPAPTRRRTSFRRLTFTFGGVGFACEIDEKLYSRQRRLLQEYVGSDQSPPIHGVVDVRVTMSDAAFDRLLPAGPPDRLHTAFAGSPYGRWERGGVTLYRPVTGEPGVVQADDHLFAVGPTGIELVFRDGAPDPERLMRHVLCEVVIPTWENSGATTFHAACAAHDGRAVMVVGPKGAGKTTTVTMLAGDGGMELCGNDRTMVVGASGETLGLPLAYRLGHGQVHSEPGLAEFLHCGRPDQQRAATRDRGPATCDPAAKHVLTPGQLAGALGARVGQGGRLGLLLLPRVSADDRPFWHEPADPAEVAGELAASCYTPHDPTFKEARFRRRLVPEPALAATADRACRELAARVPALRLGWGTRGDLDPVRRELRRLVITGLGG